MSDELQRTGTGDPRRTLELLWDRQEPATRGPKRGLSVDRVVEAAVALADEEGLGALSMRRLAERLGVGTMSLYRYVPGKGELVDLMFDRVVDREPRQPLDEGTWREQLECAARASLETYLAHPWLLDLASGNRPPLGPHVMDGYEHLLAIVRGSGLGPRETQATVDLFATVVVGAARSLVSARRVEAASGISDEQWWGQRTEFWESYFDPARYPTITRIYATGSFEEPLDSFAFGLERVLDGIEALVARGEGGGAAWRDGEQPDCDSRPDAP